MEYVNCRQKKLTFSSTRTSLEQPVFRCLIYLASLERTSNGVVAPCFLNGRRSGWGHGEEGVAFRHCAGVKRTAAAKAKGGRTKREQGVSCHPLHREHVSEAGLNSGRDGTGRASCKTVTLMKSCLGNGHREERDLHPHPPQARRQFSRRGGGGK